MKKPINPQRTLKKHKKIIWQILKWLLVLIKSIHDLLKWLEDDS
ncbi:hypothetical protein GCM10010099_24510 [Streptomyces cinereus]|nr:hypothetical protein GCM10010099_24510 [Streptomyces cinereus]